jgi:hypothetical protein
MRHQKFGCQLLEVLVCARRAALTLIAAVMMLAFFAPANAASLPSDDEQEVLIRTTLMTFNDANMTAN